MARSVSLLKTFEGSESLTISAVFYDVLERLPQFFPLQRAANAREGSAKEVKNSHSFGLSVRRHYGKQ